MKIKKIKVSGNGIYPVTITDAIKDSNFINEDKSIMTLKQINQKFRSQLDGVELILKQINGE